MKTRNDDQGKPPKGLDEDRAVVQPGTRRPPATGSPDGARERTGRSRAQSDPDEGMGLAALTEAAGVSTRTVRYYIAEGLLPPPTGAGPRAAYTEAHLDRLRLIGRLKDAYLPLREIRRRLDAMTDDEVRRLLRTLEPDDRPSAQPGPLAAPTGFALREPPDTAAAYLARVRQRGAGGARPPTAPTASPADEGPLESPDAAPALSMAEMEEAPTDAVIPGAAVLPVPLPPPAESPLSGTDSEAWRRVPLGDAAELLIRESLYRRKRDRVEWLVAWARRVFR